MIKVITISAVLLYITATAAYAAVGCTLNDPDKDIKKLFPSYTSYKTEFNSIEEYGGSTTKSEVERKLGDKLDTALALGGGSAVLRMVNGDEAEDKVFSEQFACPDCASPPDSVGAGWPSLT